MAMAMNKIHGRSNTGEGGEDADRFTEKIDGLSLRSAIKRSGFRSFWCYNQLFGKC